jgi:hypothetical protein
MNSDFNSTFQAAISVQLVFGFVRFQVRRPPQASSLFFAQQTNQTGKAKRQIERQNAVQAKYHLIGLSATRPLISTH